MLRKIKISKAKIEKTILFLTQKAFWLAIIFLLLGLILPLFAFKKYLPFEINFKKEPSLRLEKENYQKALQIYQDLKEKIEKIKIENELEPFKL